MMSSKNTFSTVYFPALPSLAWSMGLKHTQVELDLITNPEIYQMIENSIRGGISTTSNQYSKANNPLLEDYDLPTPPLS